MSDTIDSLVRELASSRADALQPKARKALLDEAHHVLQTESAARQRLAEWNGTTGTSKMFSNRIFWIISHQIFATLSLYSDIECSSPYAYRRIVALLQLSIQQPTDQGDGEVTKGLLRNLTRLLDLSNNAELADSCRDKLAATVTNKQPLIAWLMELAPTSVAAISLGSALDPSDVNAWLPFLLQHGSSHNLKLTRSFIQSLSVETWTSILSNQLQLKLKSHPDKSLSTVLVWLQYLSFAVVLDQDWMDLILKHLLGPKDLNRDLASQICLAVEPSSAHALAQAMVVSPISLAPARQTVYECLVKMAIHVNDDAFDVVDTVLQGLINNLIVKETKHRLLAFQAMIKWLAVPKHQSEGYKAAIDVIRNQKPDVLRELVQRVRPDQLDRIVVDLFDSKEWQQSIEASMVESKRSVDAVVAVHLNLLYATSTQKALPAVVVDALTNKNKSCLYPSIESTTGMDGDLLVRSMALYSQLVATRPSLPALFAKQVTSSARALALCLSNPTMNKDTNKSIVACLTTILTNQPDAAEGIAHALFDRVNASSVALEESFKADNATRESWDIDRESLTKKDAYSSNTIRRVGKLLVKHCTSAPLLARVMILMHAGSTLRSEGPQRASLIQFCLQSLNEVVLPLENVSLRAELADEIVSVCTVTMPADGATRYSQSIRRAALSLLVSLGGIAGNSADEDEMKPYTFANKLCIQEIATRLSTRLKQLVSNMEALSEKDVRLYLSPSGSLFDDSEEKLNLEAPKSSGKRLSEDEEWDLQTKRQIEEKNRNDRENRSKQRSPEEVKIISEQDKRRDELTCLLEDDLSRVLDAIRYLCVSDIEVGNECLPVLMNSVLAAATTNFPAVQHISGLKEKAEAALGALAATVYEIDESHAPTLAQALLVSCRRAVSTAMEGGSPDKGVITEVAVQPLPSPCTLVACTISEMDDIGDCLSGPSFTFLFPILRASLMGPRTIPGCEGSVRVLERHTRMLFGQEKNDRVVDLRLSMAVGILELLKHDRSQTFQDPSPFAALIHCYDTDHDSDSGPALTTSELAPLLDERGALGQHNCRHGAMLALNHIALHHQKLVKNNPLIENRIWLNCFDQDEHIRMAARAAWVVAKGGSEIDLNDVNMLPDPFPFYAPPLIPLLSHSNKSIANAAAVAFANAMAKHPKSVAKNTEMICIKYIDAFPTEEAETSGTTTGSILPLPVKKAVVIATGLPKKKAPVNKSALSVAGIGKPKVVKKKIVSSDILKPKQERTLDQDALTNQFALNLTKKDGNEDTAEKVSVRLGVLRAIAAMTSSSIKIELDDDTLKLLTIFLIAYGIAESNEEVKGRARDSLREVVAANGDTDRAISFLLPQLENVLSTGAVDDNSLGSSLGGKIPKNVSASDRRKEGAVIALGSVALHLKGAENEGKIDNTIDMLISTLKTPSEGVQISVADCLVKLMTKGRTQERMESIMAELMAECLNGSALAVQRGAAYGLSAAVKGSGIVTLKKFEIVKQLEEACSSGSSKAKEGSLFAIELLSARLGLLFEPYVIALLPSLLKCFSDSSDHVRQAASTTVGVIMGKLSAHGVKLVMPAVLTAFEDPAWRTKQASIQMLGAMSHLAPKQLASALPKVVPKLTEAFSDTHVKVKGAAQEALHEISTVVRNPEISSISSVLLKALTDPADCTIKALETLIETEFLHAIDAPSLALIVPILHRGLRDRGATTKRFSSLITGNITTMINDSKDLVPYLPVLLPDLQSCLMDPIPDVRSTAAKALGSLTRSLGDQILPELRPWLIKKLREEGCSSAERSGAAQGLTEVLIASGSNDVDDAMRNDILPLSRSPSASTREGVLWMLTFLPPTMGQGFTSLIDVSLPALIGGLSDDSELVRDVAMRAGRVLIRSHGKVHVDKILPSLEDGLGNDDYRIRVAALSLLGDLLSMIGNTTLVKGEGDTADDQRKAEKAQAQIALVLGAETRRRVLSGLYLARSDSVHAVRQSALQVWKTVVSVTGRALRDILPVLVSKIVDDLASGDFEKTDVAGRCLGDVVTKLGDSVLPQIIPVLRNALNDGDQNTKRGVCVGLNAVIKCSTKDQILRFIEIIVKVVQDALCEDDANVRKTAAGSFKSLHNVVGVKALELVVPSLMVSLESDDEVARARALNGLTSILGVRSRELLPFIIPRLISRPITVEHARALSGIALVTGGSLYHHFSTILPNLLEDLAEDIYEKERTQALIDCVRSICVSVAENGISILVNGAASKCGSDKAPLRRESVKMLGSLITERKY
jgi:hypothetical protein